MARPLRVDVENGWYHVTSRGIERRSIFDNEAEHLHFIELLGDMVDRFRVMVHAHVELDNRDQAFEERSENEQKPQVCRQISVKSDDLTPMPAFGH